MAEQDSDYLSDLNLSVVIAKLLQRKATAMGQVMPTSQACGQLRGVSVARCGFAAVILTWMAYGDPDGHAVWFC